MTSRKHINAIARASVARLPHVRASASDPDVVSGKLITEREALEFFVSEWTRLFERLERAVAEMAVEAEGKTAAQIGRLNKRKLDTIFYEPKHTGHKP